MEQLKLYLNTTKQYCTRKTLFLVGSIAFALLCGYWIWATSAPSNLEIPASIEIERGDSVKQIIQKFDDAGIIRSRTIANSLIILGAGDRRVVSGTYLFETRPSVFEVVRRITLGDFGIETKAVRIPEGATIAQIGELFEQEFLYFDKEAFYQLTEGKEGYMFPDTYLFLETVKAYEVVAMLEHTFSEKIAELTPLMKESDRTLEEVVIMASIVEKEATAEARQEVANILWKRLEIEMPLQVDATFVYSVGKGTFDLTKKDLQDESNPYNTYTHPGLPPSAISNPGIDALKAAATKQDTDDLFFLTGHDGEMYYAETFEGHKKNRERHLY